MSRKPWYVATAVTSVIAIGLLAAAVLPSGRGQRQVLAEGGRPAELASEEEAMARGGGEPEPGENLPVPKQEAARPAQRALAGVTVPTLPVTVPTLGISPSTSRPATTTTRPAPPAKPMPDCPRNDLRLREPPTGMSVKLSLSKATFSPGEPVAMTLRARNESQTTVRNYQPSIHRVADFWVMREDKTIWRLSWEHSAGAAAGQEEQFAPGEEKQVAASWDQRMCNPATAKDASADKYLKDPLPRGRYIARALWESTPDGQWASNAVEFEVR